MTGFNTLDNKVRQFLKSGFAIIAGESKACPPRLQPTNVPVLVILGLVHDHSIGRFTWMRSAVDCAPYSRETISNSVPALNLRGVLPLIWILITPNVPLIYQKQ
jgi:hypothetical protein